MDEWNLLLVDALAAIGKKSPAVVEALRSIVDKRGRSSGIRAVTLLASFGPAAQNVLDSVQGFLFDDEDLIVTVKTAENMLAALGALAGDARAPVTQFIHYMRRLPDIDVAAFAQNCQEPVC